MKLMYKIYFLQWDIDDDRPQHTNTIAYELSTVEKDENE